MTLSTQAKNLLWNLYRLGTLDGEDLGKRYVNMFTNRGWLTHLESGGATTQNSTAFGRCGGSRVGTYHIYTITEAGREAAREVWGI